jgi:hypothetical protein
MSGALPPSIAPNSIPTNTGIAAGGHWMKWAPGATSGATPLPKGSPSP